MVLHSGCVKTDEVERQTSEPAHAFPPSENSGHGQEPLIAKDELARRLCKTARTVDKWMQNGYLPYIKIGRTVLFRWSTVLLHLENRFRVNG